MVEKTKAEEFRERHKGTILDDVPLCVGSDICKQYGNEDTGVCAEECPFIKECTPFFEKVAGKLEEAME